MGSAEFRDTDQTCPFKICTLVTCWTHWQFLLPCSFRPQSIQKHSSNHGMLWDNLENRTVPPSLFWTSVTVIVMVFSTTSGVHDPRKWITLSHSTSFCLVDNVRSLFCQRQNGHCKQSLPSQWLLACLLWDCWNIFHFSCSWLGDINVRGLSQVKKRMIWFVMLHLLFTFRYFLYDN